MKVIYQIISVTSLILSWLCAEYSYKSLACVFFTIAIVYGWSAVVCKEDLTFKK